MDQKAPSEGSSRLDSGCLSVLDTLSRLRDDMGQRSDANGKTPSVDASTASSTPSPHPEDRAERRQVTVMFSAK
jgi:hypothetical protein